MNKYVTNDSNDLVNNPLFDDNSSQIATTKFVTDSIKNYNPVRRGMFSSENNSNGMILENNFIKPSGNELIWNTNHPGKGIRLTVSENDDFIPWGKGGTWCWREPEAKSFESLNFFTTENNDGTDNSIGYPYDVKFQLWGTNDLTLVADNTYNDTQHPYSIQKKEVTNNGWTFIGDFAFTGKNSDNHYKYGSHKILKKDVLGMGDLISKSDWTIPAEAFGIWMIYIPNTSDYFQNPLTIQSVITDTSQQNIQLDIPDGNNTVEILVVGGGGAGGRIHDTPPPDMWRVLNQFTGRFGDGGFDLDETFHPSSGVIWNTKEEGKGVKFENSWQSGRSNQLLITNDGDRWVFAPWGNSTAYIWREQYKVSFQSLNFYITDTTNLGANSNVQLWGCKKDFEFKYQKLTDASNKYLLICVKENFMPMTSPNLSDNGLSSRVDPNDNWVFLGTFNLGSDNISGIGPYSFPAAEISTEKFGVFMMIQPYVGGITHAPTISRVAINIKADDETFWGNGGDVVGYDSNLDYLSPDHFEATFGPFDIQMSTVTDYLAGNMSSRTYTVAYPDEFTTIKNAGGGAGGLIHIPEWNITGETTLDITIGEGGKFVNNSTGVSGQGGNTIVKAGSTKTLTAFGGGMGDSDGNLFAGVKQGHSGGCGGGGFKSFPGLSLQLKNTNDGVNTYSNSGFGTPSNIPYNISPNTNGFGVGDIIQYSLQPTIHKYLNLETVGETHINTPSWGTSLSSTFSISMWIYNNGGTHSGGILSQGWSIGNPEHGWMIYFGRDQNSWYNHGSQGADKCIRFATSNSSNNFNHLCLRDTPANTIQDNTWHHLVIIRDNYNIDIYIDSIKQVLVEPFTNTSPPPQFPVNNTTYTNGTKLTLGAIPERLYFLDTFKGFIDQLYIFDIAISNSFVDELYSSRYFSTTSVINMSGIIAYWNFNDSVESRINSNDVFSGNTPVYILDTDAPVSENNVGTIKRYGFVHPSKYHISGQISDDKLTWTPWKVQTIKNPTQWVYSGDGEDLVDITSPSVLRPYEGIGFNVMDGNFKIGVSIRVQYSSAAMIYGPLTDDSFTGKTNGGHGGIYFKNDPFDGGYNGDLKNNSDYGYLSPDGYIADNNPNQRYWFLYERKDDDIFIYYYSKPPSDTNNEFSWDFWKQGATKLTKTINSSDKCQGVLGHMGTSGTPDKCYILFMSINGTVFDDKYYSNLEERIKQEQETVNTTTTTSLNRGGIGKYFGNIFGNNVGTNGWFGSGGISSVTGSQLDFNINKWKGGGGDGNNNNISTISNAIENTGGGGGSSGNGGSGIVIVKYKKYISKLEHVTPLISRIAINTSADDTYWSVGDIQETPSHKTNTTYRINYVSNKFHNQYVTKLIFPEEDERVQVRRGMFSSELYSYNMTGTYNVPNDGSLIWNTNQDGKGIRLHTSQYHENYPWGYGGTWCWREPTMKSFESLNFYTTETLSRDSDTRFQLWATNELKLLGDGIYNSSQHPYGFKNNPIQIVNRNISTPAHVLPINGYTITNLAGSGPPFNSSNFTMVVSIQLINSILPNDHIYLLTHNGGRYFVWTVSNEHGMSLRDHNNVLQPYSSEVNNGSPGNILSNEHAITYARIHEGSEEYSIDIHNGIISDRYNNITNGFNYGGHGLESIGYSNQIPVIIHNYLIYTRILSDSELIDISNNIIPSGPSQHWFSSSNPLIDQGSNARNLTVRTSEYNLISNPTIQYKFFTANDLWLNSLNISETVIDLENDKINNWTFIGDFSFKDTHDIRGAHTIGKLDTLGAAANYTSSEWIPKIPNNKFGIWMIYCPNISPYTSESDVTYKNTPLMSRIGINTPSDNQSWIDDIKEIPTDKINTEYTIKYSATQNIQSKPVTKPEKENLILTSVKDGCWDWKEPTKVSSFDSIKLSDNTIIATIPNIQTEILANNEKIEATGIRFHVLTGQLRIHSLGIYRTKDDMDNNNNNIAKESGVTFKAGSSNSNTIYTVDKNQEYFINTGSAKDINMGHTLDGKRQASRDYNDNYVVNFPGLREIKYIRFPDYMHNGTYGNQIFRVEYTVDGISYTSLNAFSINDRNLTTENFGLISAYNSNPQYIDNQFWQLEKKTKPNIQYHTKSVLGPIIGDGISIIYVDTQNTGAEGVVPITDRPNPSNTNKHGVFWGNRLRYWMVHDEAFFYLGRDIAHNRLINGSYWNIQNEPDTDNNFPHYHRPGGHVTLTPYGPYRYNFTRFYTGLKGNSNSFAYSNHEFRVSASNNGAIWITLCDFKVRSMIYDPDRQFTVGTDTRTQTDLTYKKYFIEWENTNYYSMWRVSHIDDGYAADNTNPPHMSSGSTQGYNWLINVNYCFSEYEWG